MIEKIAMWGGIAGIVVALFAVIILFLTRKNILDILDKDVILFDRNFDIKKSALEHSFRLIDRIEQTPNVVNDPAFKQEAKSCYNELLCVVSDLKVAFVFYNLAIKGNNIVPYFKYKLLARYDIGLSNKHGKKIKKGNNDYISYSKPTPPAVPVTKPVEETNEQPKAVAPQPAPVQPTPTVRPVTEPIRPVPPAPQPAQTQPVKQVSTPNSTATKPTTTTKPTSVKPATKTTTTTESTTRTRTKK